MLVQPLLPRVIPLPQYSQVMTISPNFGEIGAPQFGHFSEVASIGASTGALGCRCGLRRLPLAPLRLAPHFMQKAAPSGFWAPHLGQIKRNRSLERLSALRAELGVAGDCGPAVGAVFWAVCGAGAGWATAAPQLGQNLAPACRGVPHWAQVCVGCALRSCLLQ